MLKAIDEYFGERMPTDIRKKYDPLITFALEYLSKSSRSRRIYAEDPDAGALSGHFGYVLPLKGEPLDEIVSEIADKIAPYCRNRRARGYFAHMDVPPTDLSVFSGLIIRALDQDPVSFSSSPSGTFVEKQMDTSIYPVSGIDGDGLMSVVGFGGDF